MPSEDKNVKTRSGRSALFEPLRVRKMELKNRIVATPLGLSRYIDSTGSPSERMVARHRRHALGGVALTTVEATYVEAYEPTRSGLMGFYSDRQIPQFAALTDGVHSAGGKIAMQILDRWHADFPYEMDDLSVTQIEKMIDCYVRAAVRVMMAGFDAVNLQMTHGWPLSRFASPLTNHRHDRYGEYSYVGSQVIKRVRAEVGNELVIIPRFTVVEDIQGQVGVTLSQAVNELAPAFEAAGADIFDLSFGLGPIARDAKDYWATELIYVEPGARFEHCRAIKSVTALPVIGRSGVNDPVLARQAVDEGWVDLLGLGRQILADPDFPRKLEAGRDDIVNHCIRCQFCGRVTVGGAQVVPPLRCSVNGELGREIDIHAPALPIGRRKVIVVGAGVAGMQAALSLAARDCEVTLYERSPTLGGAVTILAELPHLRLSDLRYAVEDLERKLRETSVSFRLGEEFTESMADTVDAHAVVVATGSTPGGRGPALEGEIVRPYSDYLLSKRIGDRVVIDGRGEGAEFAVSLARGGHKVTLVESGLKLPPAPYDYAVKRVEALGDYLEDSGVQIMLRSQVTAVAGNVVTIQARNGNETSVQADTLLIAGRTARRSLTAALRQRMQAVYEIGDSAGPRGLGEAFEEGRAVAVSIAG